MKVLFTRGSWASERLNGGGSHTYPGNAAHVYVVQPRDVAHRWIARVRRWKLSFHVSYQETVASTPPASWQMERDIVYLSGDALGNERQILGPPSWWSGNYVGDLELQTSLVAEQTGGDPQQVDLLVDRACTLRGIDYLFKQDGAWQAALYAIFSLTIRRAFAGSSDTPAIYGAGDREPPDPGDPPLPSGVEYVQLIPMIEGAATNTLYGTRHVGEVSGTYDTRTCQVSNFKLEPIKFWGYGGKYDEDTGALA